MQRLCCGLARQPCQQSAGHCRRIICGWSNRNRLRQQRRQLHRLLQMCQSQQRLPVVAALLPARLKRELPLPLPLTVPQQLAFRRRLQLSLMPLSRLLSPFRERSSHASSTGTGSPPWLPTVTVRRTARPC